MSQPPYDASAESTPSGVGPKTSVDFGEFYRQTVNPLRIYLARLLGDRTEAQDIAQEAFLKTQAAMRGRQLERPRAFLFTTARNLAHNFRFRRLARVQTLDAAEFDERVGTTSDAAQHLMAQQEEERFNAAILALPPGCQQVLVLRIKQGLSHNAIAEKLNLSPSTVANQLTRAIRLLRTTLQAPAQSAANTGEGSTNKVER